MHAHAHTHTQRQTYQHPHEVILINTGCHVPGSKTWSIYKNVSGQKACYVAHDNIVFSPMQHDKGILIQPVSLWLAMLNYVYNRHELAHNTFGD